MTYELIPDDNPSSPHQAAPSLCAERTAERDRARGTAAAQEAENARLREGIESMMRDVGKAQPAHVTPGIVAVRLKALLAEDEGGE